MKIKIIETEDLDTYEEIEKEVNTFIIILYEETNRIKNNNPELNKLKDVEKYG